MKLNEIFEQTGYKKSLLIRARKKLQAKRMNPKPSKTSTMRTSGTYPHDPAMSADFDSTHGSRYQASVS